MKYRVEWGVRHNISTGLEHVRTGAMVGSKAAMEGLFNQLTKSFGAESGEGSDKLTWGNTRMTWNHPLRLYWVTIETL
jgi:hypothetical protein